MELHVLSLLLLLVASTYCFEFPEFHLGGSGQSRIGGNVSAHGSLNGIGASVGGGVGTDLEGTAKLNDYKVEGKTGGELGGEAGAHATFKDGLKGTVNATGVADYYGSLGGQRQPKASPVAPNNVPVSYIPYAPNPGMPAPYPYAPYPVMPAPYPYGPNPAIPAPNDSAPNYGMPAQYPYYPYAAAPGQYPYAPNPYMPGPYPYQGTPSKPGASIPPSNN